MNFIVKLFPEITIKSKPVRKRMVDRLSANLRIVLKRIHSNITVQAQWDRILVNFPDTPNILQHYQQQVDAGMVSKTLSYSEYRHTIVGDICEVLQTTSGISYSVLVKSYDLVDLATLLQHTLNAYRPDAEQTNLTDKRFAVRVKRTGKHTFTSHEAEVFIGTGLLEHNQTAKVDLSNPEITVNIEIKDNQAFLVNKRLLGLGGYPTGTQGSVVSLISGGFDSIAASYLTMKRGAKTHFLFFNLGGKAHEVGVQQSAYYLWRKFGSAARVKFISVPFEDVAAEILQQIDHSHRGVVLKRMMVRAAQQVARRYKMDALVTGESMAQVSSQTLTNLSVIDKATDALIIRPLITFDKQEIIDICRAIGAYDFAASMPEYCGVISDRPTVKARLSKVISEEENFDFTILQNALDNTQVVGIDAFINTVGQIVVHESSKVAEADVIVDVRHPDEVAKRPLNVPGAKVVNIPFFKVNKTMATLPNDKQYLLYCDKGEMSQMHARHLMLDGFDNVGVFTKK